MTPEQTKRWARRVRTVPPVATWYELQPHFGAVVAVLNPDETSFAMRIVRNPATPDRPAVIEQAMHGVTLERALDEAEALAMDLGWPCPWKHDAPPPEPQEVA